MDYFWSVKRYIDSHKNKDFLLENVWLQKLYKSGYETNDKVISDLDKAYLDTTTIDVDVFKTVKESIETIIKDIDINHLTTKSTPLFKGDESVKLSLKERGDYTAFFNNFSKGFPDYQELEPLKEVIKKFDTELTKFFREHYFNGAYPNNFIREKDLFDIGYLMLKSGVQGFFDMYPYFLNDYLEHRKTTDAKSKSGDITTIHAALINSKSYSEGKASEADFVNYFNAAFSYQYGGKFVFQETNRIINANKNHHYFNQDVIRVHFFTLCANGDMDNLKLLNSQTGKIRSFINGPVNDDILTPLNLKPEIRQRIHNNGILGYSLIPKDKKASAYGAFSFFGGLSSNLSEMLSSLSGKAGKILISVGEYLIANKQNNNMKDVEISDDKSEPDGNDVLYSSEVAVTSSKPVSSTTNLLTPTSIPEVYEEIPEPENIVSQSQGQPEISTEAEPPPSGDKIKTLSKYPATSTLTLPLKPTSYPLSSSTPKSSRPIAEPPISTKTTIILNKFELSSNCPDPAVLSAIIIIPCIIILIFVFLIIYRGQLFCYKRRSISIVCEANKQVLKEAKENHLSFGKRVLHIK